MGAGDSADRSAADYGQTEGTDVWAAGSLGNRPREAAWGAPEFLAQSVEMDLQEENIPEAEKDHCHFESR
jgi:hypothetical protein